MAARTSPWTWHGGRDGVDAVRLALAHWQYAIALVRPSPPLRAKPDEREHRAGLTRGCGHAPMRGHEGHPRLRDFSARFGSPPAQHDRAARRARHSVPVRRRDRRTDATATRRVRRRARGPLWLLGRISA